LKEKIYIDGFAGLNDFEMELNRINVLIGPQASGKSVVAKLVYFCNHIILRYFDELIDDIITEKSFEYFLRKKFKEQFYIPSGFYENKFRIEYYKNELLFKINSEFEVEVNSNLLENIAEIADEINQFKKNKNLTKKKQVLLNKMPQLIEQKITLNYFPYYIPPSRDKFTSDYIAVSNSFKNSSDYANRHFAEIYKYMMEIEDVAEYLNNGPNRIYGELIDALIANFETIIKGQLISGEKKEIVFESDYKVVYPLRHLSSGQKEIIPLFSFLYLSKDNQLHTLSNKNYFIIEEPEAHLFPKEIYRIVNIIISTINVLSEKNASKVFITTHSPFVLTSLSILTQAGHLFSNNKNSSEKIHNSISSNFFFDVEDLEKVVILPEEINAYQIQNGKAINIIDPETKLIGENIIDEVSEMDYKLFDELSDLILTTK